jgi:Txe/YoeB family toxin of Txe-Axe toxin-antitoxin module
MIVEPLNPKQEKYLKAHQLTKKYSKQITILVNNPNHPSLNTEKLLPESDGLYSFRLDIHYRAIFRFTLDHIKIIAITNHYR